MKKLLLLVLLVATVSNAQNVSIPDSEFLNALIYLGVDTNGDGTIQVSEAAARTSLDLTTAVQYYMHDVSGIEAFVNLTVLKLPLANSIQSLNVGSMNALEYLQINGSHNLSVLTFGYHPYLTHLDCGNSSLTTLDLSGAPNLTYLDCSQNYLNSLDLSMLSQLTHLNTHFNPLLALDVSNSPNLTFLDCSQGLVLGSSGIASVNINGCIHLTHLDISSNSISVLNVAPLSELVYLDVSGNAISALDVSNLNGLTYLGANGNPITVLNVSALTNLTTLNCNLCLITTLDVAALTNLTSLSCSGNQIGVLNVSNLSNLTYLDCSANQISSLNLQNLNVLNVLYCQNNMLANLSVSANTTLHGLYFGNPGLNTVDVGMLTNLTGIGYFGGLQQSLNISGLSLLSSVALSGISGSFDLSNFNGQPVSQFTLYNNPDLTYLNIKTGQHVEALFSNNPVLTNICTNEDDIQYVTDHMNNGQNNFDFTVSSYCSFTPGGSYNTISGVFHLDANNDGCTATDVIPPSVKVSINDGTIVGSTFTNSLGSYSVYSNGTNIVLTPQLENPAYFNVSPTSQTMIFPDDNNHVSTADFCMTANGIHPDVEVTIVPLHPARPGFDADYNIILKNKGNQVFAGALDFSYNDSVLDLLSSVPLADAQSLGSLSWNYTGLNPFATQIFHVSFNVNSPSETPPVNINDVLDFTASAAVANDETPADNSFTLHQVVVGSFDPNDKHCLQGDVVPTAQIGDFLYYSINFENTGTFPAQNVVIRDMIDADKFDISSLQVFSASHDDVVNVTGNRLEIFFENIGLEPNEYGYVAFKIKTKNELATGSSVSNTADIFFDFNQPVETNTATTTFQNLGLDNHTTNSGVSIFPNPAGNVIYIRSQSQVNSVSITDIQGRVVKQIDHPGNEPSVDTSGLTSGTYFVRLNTDAGIVTQKLIRN